MILLRAAPGKKSDTPCYTASSTFITLFLNFVNLFHIVKITVCEIYKYSCEQWPSESISRRAVHHEKPVDSSHTPYRCTSLEVRRGGRRYGCDECSVAAVQTSQLCSGLSAAPANTNMLERNRPLCVWWYVCDGERGILHTLSWEQLMWVAYLMCMVYLFKLYYFYLTSNKLFNLFILASD